MENRFGVWNILSRGAQIWAPDRISRLKSTGFLHPCIALSPLLPDDGHDYAVMRIRSDETATGTTDDALFLRRK